MPVSVHYQNRTKKYSTVAWLLNQLQGAVGQKAQASLQSIREDISSVSTLRGDDSPSLYQKILNLGRLPDSKQSETSSG